MTDKIQINLRLKEDLLKKVKEEAKKENRSVNNYIENAIKKYMELHTAHSP